MHEPRTMKGEGEPMYANLSPGAIGIRTDLAGTVDLFSKISPALRGIGLTGC